MNRFTLVDKQHEQRNVVERLIQETYIDAYNAQIDTFPSMMFALRGKQNRVLCAAGLRTGMDGFFSERYLDAPIERILGERSSRTITRDRIFEVSTLSSRAPRATAAFVMEIVRFGEENGYLWSFFTLTRRLSHMVERLGLASAFLGPAENHRIDDHARWGSYYATDPGVYAVASRSLRTTPLYRDTSECHALAF